MKPMKRLALGVGILAVTSCAGVGGCSDSRTSHMEAMVEVEYVYADLRQHREDPIRLRMLVNYMNDGSLPIVLERRQRGELISDDELFLASFEVIQHEPQEIVVEPGQFVDVTYEKISILGSEGKVPCDQLVRGVLQLTGRAGSRTHEMTAETPLTRLSCSPG